MILNCSDLTTEVQTHCSGGDILQYLPHTETTSPCLCPYKLQVPETPQKLTITA